MPLDPPPPPSPDMPLVPPLKYPFTPLPHQQHGSAANVPVPIEALGAAASCAVWMSICCCSLTVHNNGPAFVLLEGALWRQITIFGRAGQPYNQVPAQHQNRAMEGTVNVIKECYQERSQWGVIGIWE